MKNLLKFIRAALTSTLVGYIVSMIEKSAELQGESLRR